MKRWAGALASVGVIALAIAVVQLLPSRPPTLPSASATPTTVPPDVAAVWHEVRRRIPSAIPVLAPPVLPRGYGPKAALDFAERDPSGEWAYEVLVQGEAGSQLIFALNAANSPRPDRIEQVRVRGQAATISSADGDRWLQVSWTEVGGRYVVTSVGLGRDTLLGLVASLRSI